MAKKKRFRTVDPFDINGKVFALLLWGKKKAGKEDDVAVFTGKACFKDKILTVNLKGNPGFEIFPEWLSRIKKTPNDKDVKKIMFNADYFLSLSIDDEPKGTSLKFKKTGLKWPN